MLDLDAEPQIEDVSYQTFTTTLGINAFVGVVCFLVFCVLRPLKMAGLKKFFAPICFVKADNQLQQQLLFGLYESETECYPFHG